jgi:hypothetical protein
MTLRERFIEIMKFNTNIYTIKWEFGYWGETLHNWYDEGLPKKKYPHLPLTISTPTSSLYNTAWTCQIKKTLPKGIPVMAEVLRRLVKYLQGEAPAEKDYEMPPEVITKENMHTGDFYSIIANE